MLIASSVQVKDTSRTQSTAGSSTTPGGSVPVAASQPRAAIQAVTTLAMPRLMPGSGCHDDVSQREPGLRRYGQHDGVCVLADGLIHGSDRLPAPARREHIGADFHIRSN